MRPAAAARRSGEGDLDRQLLAAVDEVGAYAGHFAGHADVGEARDQPHFEASERELSRMLPYEPGPAPARLVFAALDGLVLHQPTLGDRADTEAAPAELRTLLSRADVDGEESGPRRPPAAGRRPAGQETGRALPASRAARSQSWRAPGVGSAGPASSAASCQ